MVHKIKTWKVNLIYDKPHLIHSFTYGNTYGNIYVNTLTADTPYGNPYGNTYGNPYGNIYGILTSETAYSNAYLMVFWLLTSKGTMDLKFDSKLGGYKSLGAIMGKSRKTEAIRKLKPGKT